MTESETIANELSLQYYSLDSIGIQSVAYDKSNATRLIEYCRNEVLPVIGIDIYRLNAGNVELPKLYDNWNCNKKCHESFCEFAKRSCTEAMDYICSKRFDDNTLFDIVI